MKIGEYETNNVYCADSYKAIKLIPDKSIDCIYTDIPYLYEQGGCTGNSLIAKGSRKLLNTLNDNDIFDGIDYSIFSEFVRVLKNINIFIWCSKEQIYDILKWFKENTNCTYQILTWNKTNPTPMCNGNWLPDIEYCLYFNRGTKLNDGYEHKSKWYASPKNKKDKDKFLHPTCKPVPLIERHLLHTTQPDDIVADFFMGGGSTCVACKNTNRQYLGFELVEKWYNIAKNRLNNIDGNGQMSLFTF